MRFQTIRGQDLDQRVYLHAFDGNTPVTGLTALDVVGGVARTSSATVSTRPFLSGSFVEIGAGIYSVVLRLRQEDVEANQSPLLALLFAPSPVSSAVFDTDVSLAWLLLGSTEDDPDTAGGLLEGEESPWVFLDVRQGGQLVDQVTAGDLSNTVQVLRVGDTAWQDLPIADGSSWVELWWVYTDNTGLYRVRLRTEDVEKRGDLKIRVAAVAYDETQVVYRVLARPERYLYLTLVEDPDAETLSYVPDVGVHAIKEADFSSGLVFRSTQSDAGGRCQLLLPLGNYRLVLHREGFVFTANNALVTVYPRASESSYAPGQPNNHVALRADHHPLSFVASGSEFVEMTLRVVDLQGHPARLLRVVISLTEGATPLYPIHEVEGGSAYVIRRPKTFYTGAKGFVVDQTTGLKPRMLVGSRIDVSIHGGTILRNIVVPSHDFNLADIVLASPPNPFSIGTPNLPPAPRSI